MILKSFLLLAGFAASFYATFFGCTTLWLNLLAAVLMGTFTAEFGISIMHDANHGKRTWIPPLNDKGYWLEGEQF
jgi:fatty acid desaturase